MRNALFLASLVSLTALVYACGSDGGVGTTTGGDTDSGYDSGYITNPDTGPLPQQDGTIPDPGIDASLDVQFPDGFTAPDTSTVDAGQLVDSGCSPPGISCSGNVAYTCDGKGQLFADDCTKKNLTCADGYGCVTCVPGTGSCNGSLGTVCNNTGTGYLTNDCDSLLGLTCNQGICTGTCANLGQSYIGCDYYAVTLSNPALDQVTFYASVSIANTGSSTATVTITGPANFKQTLSINPGVIVEQKLPWDANLSNQFGTVLEKGGAYRIRSTQPVTVYQFNARDYQIGNNFSYTNDASMLIPVNAMTGNYTVASMPDWFWSGNIHYPGNISIVATTDNTKVQFTPPAGINVTAGGGVAASGTSTVTMMRGDVLEIAGNKNAGSFLTYGSDPSGAVVKADNPVEVFGGSTCSFIPSSVGYCDHTEEVNFPQETLRNDYIVAPPQNTVAAPRMFVRLIGTAAGTTLTYTPSTPPGAPVSLNAGQVALFESKFPFEVTSQDTSHPIALGEYMEGEDNFQPGNANAGDPAMSMGIAKDQYRTDYTFTAPNNYAVNYATVIAPNGSTIKIDGVNVGGWVAINGTGYSYSYVSLSKVSSNHTATGTAQFGIDVYGYGLYTSYWYPGGLNLKR
jgi:IgGFc binding protein